MGLCASATGVARLAVQGTAVAMVFQHRPIGEILTALLFVLVLPLLRVGFTMAKELISYGTAAMMKVKLRRLLYAHLLDLGPSYLHRRRTGEVLLSTVDSVEQLETYFG